MRSFSRESAPLPRGTARYPVVIFSPGSGSKVLTYQALIEDLASHGWAVAAIDTVARSFSAGDLARPRLRVIRTGRWPVLSASLS
jgi:predicted dienelactone hydrolase